jgi:hypothetical protein
MEHSVRIKELHREKSGAQIENVSIFLVFSLNKKKQEKVKKASNSPRSGLIHHNLNNMKYLPKT